MEKQRKYKLFSIIALMFAVVALSVGYAAFSKVLTINASAIVTPNQEDYNVVVSGSATDKDLLTIVPEVSGGASAENGIIVNEVGISTLTASINFTEPGQSVLYTSYVHNIGKNAMYLNKIEFLPAEGYTLNKVCVADEGTDETLVAQACESITVSIIASVSGQELQLYETTEFPNIPLLTSKSLPGKLYIVYAEDGVRADGPFTVKIGGISIHYSSTN